MIVATAYHWPIAGQSWLVKGYHTGEFVGRCVSIDHSVAVFVITDTLRPLPKVRERCPYPGCVRKDFHEGDHELARVRMGGEIEVFWRNAKFVPCEIPSVAAKQRQSRVVATLASERIRPATAEHREEITGNRDSRPRTAQRRVDVLTN